MGRQDLKMDDGEGMGTLSPPYPLALFQAKGLPISCDHHWEFDCGQV